MFVILLLTGLAVFGTASVLVGTFMFKRPESDTGLYRGSATVAQCLIGFVGGGLCTIAFIVTSVLWIAVNIGTTAEVAGMEAFYRNTVGAYEYTISRTGEVEISASQPGLLDVAYIGQGQIVGLRILELRDQVEHYNGRLAWYRIFESHLVASPFIANPPDDLRPIRITDLAALQETGELPVIVPMESD